MSPTPIDEAQLRILHEQGRSQYEIARLLNVPRSTVRDRLKKLALAAPPDTPVPTPTQGTPDVHNGVLVAMLADLQELVDWWRDRKAALHQAQDAGRQTERTTFHVEKRWIEAIHRQSDLDRMTYTQIVNEAFRQYFEGK
jgi:hypothetical protein